MAKPTPAQQRALNFAPFFRPLWTVTDMDFDVTPPAGLNPGLANVAVPTITGTTTVGQTLTAVAGTYTRAATTTTYQWLNTDVAIEGATAGTYLLVAGDGGDVIKVVETVDGLVSATSAGTAAITP